MEPQIDPSRPDRDPFSKSQSLVPIDRVADELRIARGALWQKLHRSGIPIHRVRRDGIEEAAIDVVAFERLRYGAQRRGPRSTARPKPEAVGSAESLSDHVRRLEEECETARFEASALERQLAEARDRYEAAEHGARSTRDEMARLEVQLEDAKRLTLAQAETAKLLVASEERAEGLGRRLVEVEQELAQTRERAYAADRLQAEVSELRERLARSDERCARWAVELDQVRSEHAEQLGQCRRELDRRACQNGGLKSQLARARQNVEAARRELEVLRELERSQARYCDRLEGRLRGYEGADQA